MVGVDVEQARAEVRPAPPAAPRDRAATAPRPAAAPRQAAGPGAAPAPQPPLPDLRDPRFALERETLKLVVQDPMAVGADHRATSAPTTSPTRPTAPSGSWSSRPAGSAAADAGWAARLRDRATDPAVAAALSALGGRAAAEPQGRRRRVRRQHVFRLLELTALRRIAEVKSRLQRTNPVEHTDRVQPDVRRARRPRAAPPAAARPGAGRPVRLVRRGARERPPVEVGAGERLLAWAPRSRRPWVAGTRDALYLPDGAGALGAGRGRRLGPRRRAGCGSARSALGRAAARAPLTSRLRRQDADRLLELVRERVTASVVLRGTCRSRAGAASG